MSSNPSGPARDVVLDLRMTKCLFNVLDGALSQLARYDGSAASIEHHAELRRIRSSLVSQMASPDGAWPEADEPVSLTLGEGEWALIRSHADNTNRAEISLGQDNPVLAQLIEAI